MFPHAEVLGKEHPDIGRQRSQMVLCARIYLPEQIHKGGGYSKDIVHKCKMFVEMLEHKRVVMKSDQETPMMAQQQRVQKAVNVEMVLPNSKRYDSKSNGKDEKAILEVEKHIRTLKLHTEDHIGKTIPPDHPVIHWMVEYAAEVINRFRVINGKMTPQEAIRGKHIMRIMFEFG